MKKLSRYFPVVAFRTTEKCLTVALPGVVLRGIGLDDVNVMTQAGTSVIACPGTVTLASRAAGAAPLSLLA